jgi:hypothetical protein
VLLAMPAPNAHDHLNALRLGGFAALHQDHAVLAERWLGEALVLARQLGAPEHDGIAANLVHLRVSAGALDAALALLAELDAMVAPADAAAAANVPGTARARPTSLPAARPTSQPATSRLERAMIDNAAMRALEAAGDRAAARARLGRALDAVRATQATLFIGNFLANRARLEIEDGELAAARATLAELEAFEGPAPAARQRYVRALVRARLTWAEGGAAEALAALESAVDELGGDPGATVNAHALLARYRLLTGDVDGACAAARAAAATVPRDPPARPLLLAEAVLAAARLARGEAAAARAQLEAALAGPTALDEFWALHRDFAACVLGAAALATGDAPAARAAVADVRWSPALAALALAVRLQAGDVAARTRGQALLAGGRVHPVERARLEAALEAAPEPALAATPPPR